MWVYIRPFFCICCAFQNCSPWCRWSTQRSDQSVPTSRLSWQDLGFRARAWEDAGRTGANIIFASNMSQMFLAPRFSFDSQILFGAKIIIVIIVITKGKHSCHPLHARGYRSTQGAGYSDGLVIHTSRPTTMQVNFGLTDGRKWERTNNVLVKKKVVWPVQHYLYSMFDLKQRIYKKNKRLTRKHLSPQFFMWANLPSQISRVLLRVGLRIENLVTATVFLIWNLQMPTPPWWVLLLLLVVDVLKTANPSMVILPII